jgi:uncharacterized protein (TIGR02594 family)
MIETSLYQTALRFEGMKEIPGPKHNPFIQWAFSLTTFPEPYTDDDAWCSAIMNAWCYIAGLPRSGSAAAISWLEVGQEITLDQAVIGEDILVFAHHVTIFAGRTNDKYVKGLGGNQNNKVGIDLFDVGLIRGVRRLA